MTEEEKEAIEYFNKRMDICLENADICDENNFDEEATYLRKERILTETILNLIQKQQEEIEKKEHKYRDLKLKYEQNLKMCKHFRKELNKQDKIIDEMANYIITHHQVKSMKKTFCENCTECEGIVRDCIKQYFERKVEV